MNYFKKATAVFLAFVLVFALFIPYASAATKKITGIKILKLPVKTIFYEEEDWVYGTWTIEEHAGSVPQLNPSTKISFTYNPCGGAYPERGMLDMRGLVIEISYSDGTKEEREYSERIDKCGFPYGNILVSPKDGKNYFIGVNTMEVYLAENVMCYDSYDVELRSKDQKPVYFRAKEGSTTVIGSNKYITGLKTTLSASQLFSDFIEYENVEVTVNKVQKSFKYIGTGATVSVKYPDGTEEVYTIIIYGDYDGNSLIDAVDVSNLMAAVSSNTALTAPQKKAVDIDGMRNVSTNDVATIKRVVEGQDLNQVSPSKSR